MVRNKCFLRDNKQKVTKQLAYQILKYPYITEKTTKLAQEKYMTFIVGKEYNKCDIKKACELIYEIEVEKVNVINQKSRTRSFKGKKYKRATIKKAMVLFKNNNAISEILGGSV